MKRFGLSDLFHGSFEVSGSRGRDRIPFHRVAFSYETIVPPSTISASSTKHFLIFARNLGSF